MSGCCCSCYIAGAIVGLLALLKAYLKFTTGRCTSTRRLDGKTVIVTGSNTGIGAETAKDMARRGARVILACRNITKAQEVADGIVRETQNKNVLVKALDLTSFKSVRTFAESILKSEERLDILINNAGMIGTPNKQVTED